MRTIVCFGDSNTHGYDSRTGGRFDRETHWPGHLAKLLGEGYSVIEEGLSGRTTVIPGVEMYPYDYMHLSPDAHRALAGELAKRILTRYNGSGARPLS